jgi:hypothetical protein
MAKIKLGNRPKTFKHKLKVALPEGGEGEIEMVYKYRTRTEFGAFLDDLFAEAKVNAKSQAEDDVVLSLETALASTRDTNADYILKIAEGWNLSDEEGDPVEFSRANVAQLCDELPGVAMQIINVYRTAVAEGRLGN